MILGINGIIASSSFDPSYQAILQYAKDISTLPSASQQFKQNKMLVDLKAAGIWDKLDTFGVFATDGNSNYALIDWKRLVTYTGIPTLTFTTNQGFTGNGTSAYIDLNYNGATQRVNYADDSAHQMVWVRNITPSSPIATSNFASTRSNIQKTSSGNNGINSSNATTLNATSSVGFIMYSRNSSLGYNQYNNNTLLASPLQTRNQTGGAAALLRSNTSYSANQISIQSLGADLSSLASTYYTILNTYMTSL